MKIRIHMLGNINLICEYEDWATFWKGMKYQTKKLNLIEIEYPGASSKFIDPSHIVAIEEYIGPIAQPVQTVDVQ